MRKLLATGVGLLMLAGLAQAAQAEQEKNESKVTLEEVVVTATKTAEKRRDIPNSLVVKDSLDIQESPANNLGQLLANDAGIDWRSYGDYGGASQAFMIRGMQSEESLVLINGLQLNSPSLGEADVSSILLNNIEQVEVVKGSGSLLYGSGAMAGTVNIITKEPSRDRMDLSLKGGYGSQNTYQLSAENGMFIADDIGYYATANRLETDGHRDNGDLVQNDASLKLIYDKGNLLKISFYGQVVDRDYGTPGIKPPDGTNDFYLPATGEKLYSSESASLKSNTESQDIHSVLEITSQPADWLRYRIAGKYTHTDSIHETWLNADDPWGTGLLAGEASRSQVTNKVLGAEANVEIEPAKSTTILVGADFHDHDWDTKSTDLNIDGTAKGSETTNSADIYNVGTFGEAQYRPFRILKLQYGYRQEYHSSYGAEYLPRYGLILNPWKSTAVKLNRGKHFKAPTPNDLYWPDGPFTRGNPNLKPQTGWHTDVTAEQEIADDRLFISASYFDWDINGKIAWAPNPAFGGKWTPTNLNSSRAHGWEAGLKFRPTPQLTLSADYTRTDAKEDVGTITRVAQYVPDNQYKISAVYRSAMGTLASTTLRYTDDRFYYRSNSSTEPDDILDSYITVDLKLEQRFKENWLVSANVYNLFDQKYDTYISYFKDSGGTRIYGAYPGAGQSWFVSITYEY